MGSPEFLAELDQMLADIRTELREDGFELTDDVRAAVKRVGEIAARKSKVAFEMTGSWEYALLACYGVLKCVGEHDA